MANEKSVLGEVFYEICSDAIRRVESQGGSISNLDFWVYLEELKLEYNLSGNNVLNPVWWALTKHYNLNDKGLENKYLYCVTTVDVGAFKNQSKDLDNSGSNVSLKNTMDEQFIELADEYKDVFIQRTKMTYN
ncbi:MAG: hypothetical protein K0B02_01920 [DPANN group archaeon]|nr:hypothetical protein [DPANN group archaeon]